MNYLMMSKLRSKACFLVAFVLVFAFVLMPLPFNVSVNAQEMKTDKAAMPTNTASRSEASMKDLETIVGDSALVNFGESSHFMKGLHSFATSAFRHLAEKKGFRVFVLESAWGVDEATQEFFKSDRTAITSDEGFFLNAFGSKETIELLIWIREFNRQHPNDQIRVAGYQPEQPVTDFKALWAFAGKSKNFASADLKSKTAVCKASTGEFKTNIEFIGFTVKQRRAGQPSYTTEERAACLKGIDEVESFIEQNKKELIAKNSLNAYRETQPHLKSLKTYIGTLSRYGDEFTLNKNMTKEQELAWSHEVYETGDKARFEIFQVLRETRYKGKKMMLWMHNWHAAERSDEIEFAGQGGIPKGTISLGTRLARTYGNKLITIGSIVPCPSCKFPERDDGFAPKFAAVFGQGSALIDLRSNLRSKLAPQSSNLKLDSPGSIIQQFHQSHLIVSDLSRQFDAIYYLSESNRTSTK
ncbi:MAG: erythromycin esterase family protein [Blastocatellia bacterium]